MKGSGGALVAAWFAGAGLLAGCAADRPVFDHLSFRAMSSAPGVVSLRPLEVRIEQGIAVKARVSALDRDGSPMPLLELFTSNGAVFEVADGPSPGDYVFFGVTPGKAEMDVYSDGRLATSLPVTVAAPGGM